MKRTHQTDMTPIARLARRIARLPATALPACAALCLALFACAQPPPPQPTPQSTFALAPTTTPTSPSVAIATLTAQPAPTPSRHQPPADIAFTQISAGASHACGLRENGAISCWGQDEHAAGIIDAHAQTAFHQISAGLGFTCGLRQDATIACWGLNSDGQASPPQGSFSEIAAGAKHACAVPRDSPRELLCWGEPFPNGAETLPLDAPLSDIQSGGSSTCGLTPQADIACVQTQQRLTEITPGPFTHLDVGLNHVCALREDGSAFCQGGNNHHRQASPPSTTFAQIAAGWFHSCGITQVRAIECWGSGRAGAPGERLAAPDGDFVAISIGWRNSCALRPNGRAVCWRTPDHLPSDYLPIGVAEAFGGAKFDWPLDIFQWPSGGLAIVDRTGVITAHYDEPNAPPPQTILDISDSVVCCPGEIGMLTAALDPQFEEFPFLYVWYGAVADNALGEGTPGFVGRLSRFRVNRGGAIKRSELIILEANMPRLRHLGGAVRFGADSMLYLGIGDGRTPADAQSLNTLRGKIIRIDVRGATADQPYRIPPDNPFVDTPGARPEIWAYGLRNPWRMTFHHSANPDRLFVGDVGGTRREEVSIATAGANLGWPLCEADICQKSLDGVHATKLTPPAVAYGRDLGCVVVSGVTVPWLDNGFIFGDACSRRVWLLERGSLPDSAQNWRMREIADLSASVRNIFSFGTAADGSVYVLSPNARILRLYSDLIE